MVFVDSVAADVHGLAEKFSTNQPGAELFEIRALASVYLDIQVCRGRFATSTLRSTLDRNRESSWSRLAEGVVNFGEVAPIERIEFSIVGGGVLRPKPPAPIAALCCENSVIPALSLKRRLIKLSHA